MKNPVTPAKPKLPRLHQLLHTKREDEQVQLVTRMIGAPVVVVTIVLDARDNHLDVTVMGGRGQGLPPDLVYGMLDGARRQLQAQERPNGPAPAGTDAPPLVEVPPSGPPDEAVSPY